jgi:hypothetical protein
MKRHQLSQSKGDVLTNSGETSLLKGLSAKAAGVSIVSNSGDPGSGAYVQIRGQKNRINTTFIRYRRYTSI